MYEESSPPVTPPPPERSGENTEAARLRRLLWIFALLFAVLVAPSVAGRVQYALTAAQERARYDVARANLVDLNLNQVSDASRRLAQFVGPSVVNVRTSRPHGEGQGSGVIVDADGYVITNYHVVAGVDTAEVQLSDGRRGKASVVGRDELVDVAVLKTELDDLIPAEWGNSDDLAVGEMVWALGSPFGLQRSITFGILSAKNRHGISGVSRSKNLVYQEFLQTDAAVNPGNSGGPLVNAEGKVVGINTAIIGESYSGISFSIPSTIARDSYEQLRRDGVVRRGWLGVQPNLVTEEIASSLGLERNQGVHILRVVKNTPAEEAGIEPGDVILSWNGIECSEPTQMSRAIASTAIGLEVPVEIVRLGTDGPERLTLTVKVAALPSNNTL